MGNKVFNIAIVGATGAVGQKIMDILQEKNFPIGTLKLLSSERSAGKKIIWNDREITVEVAKSDSFSGIDIAFFSAGGEVSRKLAPEAVKQGAIVIDNTSAYRMNKNVPLIVPEVNSDHLNNHQGIIANPNCSTIQMAVALKPIKEAFGLNRIVVSTYQAVSGAGRQAEKELETQTKQYIQEEEMVAETLPVRSDEKHFPIAFNALPQIDVFEENGFTAEEMKMIQETKKIFNDQTMSIAATCVRLPIVTSHSESIYIETDQEEVSVAQIRDVLEKAEGVVLQDDPSTQTYPTPLDATNKEPVFVGRLRKDLDNEQGFHMWVVGDNLMKGAALNTVQIAQSLIENKLV